MPAKSKSPGADSYENGAGSLKRVEVFPRRVVPGLSGSETGRGATGEGRIDERAEDAVFFSRAGPFLAVVFFAVDFGAGLDLAVFFCFGAADFLAFTLALGFGFSCSFFMTGVLQPGGAWPPGYCPIVSF